MMLNPKDLLADKRLERGMAVCPRLVEGVATLPAEKCGSNLGSSGGAQLARRVLGAALVVASIAACRAQGSSASVPSATAPLVSGLSAEAPPGSRDELRSGDAGGAENARSAAPGARGAQKASKGQCPMDSRRYPEAERAEISALCYLPGMESVSLEPGWMAKAVHGKVGPSAEKWVKGTFHEAVQASRHPRMFCEMVCDYGLSECPLRDAVFREHVVMERYLAVEQLCALNSDPYLWGQEPGAENPDQSGCPQGREHMSKVIEAVKPLYPLADKLRTNAPDALKALAEAVRVPITYRGLPPIDAEHCPRLKAANKPTDKRGKSPAGGASKASAPEIKE